MRILSLKTIIATLQKYLTDNSKDKLQVVVTSKVDMQHYKLVTAKPIVSKAFVYTSELNEDSVSTLFNSEDLKRITSLHEVTSEVILIEIP